MSAKEIYASCIAKGMSNKKAYATTGAILEKMNASRKAKAETK